MFWHKSVDVFWDGLDALSIIFGQHLDLGIELDSIV
jgi:hypothetical protein